MNLEQTPVSATAPLPGSSLAARVRTGAGWMAASSLVMHVLTLGRSIVLARLLAKEDFGLFGMALTVTGALSVLTNLGLEGSVIANTFKTDEEMEEQLNTIWTTELGRRLLLTFLLWAAIYPTAKFYGDQRLLTILPILSLVPLLEGLDNIGLILLRRSVNFVRVVWFDLSCAAVQTIVPVALALVTRNVWALVWGQVIAVALGSIFSYGFYPRKPRFAFNRHAFDKAFHFGKYMFVIGIMSYINTTADNIFVGKLLGAAILGGYVVAYSLAGLPTMVYSRVLGSILFPAYTELAREGGERLERAVVRVFLLATAGLMLIIAPLMLLSRDIVVVLYGDKWRISGPILQILLLMSLWRGLLQLVGPLLLGLNRPDLEARSKVFESVFFLTVLVPLTLHYGAIGAAWAGVLVASLSCLLRFSFVQRLVPAAFAHIPTIIVKSLMAGAAGIAAGWCTFGLTSVPLLRCLLSGPMCMLATAAVLLLLQPRLRAESSQLLVQVRQRLRRAPAAS